MELYPEERQQEIIDNFMKLLVEADNFPREHGSNDYKLFWTGLRLEGSNLLGLTNHLSDQLSQLRRQDGNQET